MEESRRDQAVRWVQKMLNRTTANGCTPAEAAGFAAKAAELIERFQIEEAELNQGKVKDDTTVEVVGFNRKVLNPGESEMVSSIARGFDCQVVTWNDGMAWYTIIGLESDVGAVKTLSETLVRELGTRAILEGREHGEEKAGLVRWRNQYLMGAALEISNRLFKAKEVRQKEDAERVKAAQGSGTTLTIITPEQLSAQKRVMVKELTDQIYPDLRAGPRSKATTNETAHRRGREAGKQVQLFPSVTKHDSTSHIERKT